MAEENSGNSSLFQYRSVQKCLSDGISFLTDHFHNFLWLTLPLSLPFALVVAALIYLACDVTVVTDGTLLWVIVGTLSLCAVILSAGLVAVIYRLLQLADKGTDVGHLSLRSLYTRQLLPMFTKTLCVDGMVAAICIVFALIMNYIVTLPEDDVLATTAARIVGFVVLTLLAVAVLTPTTLWIPGVLLGEGRFVSRIRTANSWGWRRWGKVFSLNMLVGLIVWIVSTLLFAPAIVIALMQRNATMSIIAGDAVDLPSSFSFWAGLIFVVSAFIYTLLLWLQHVPIAYQYSTAKVSMDEEQNLKKPLI